MPYSPLIIAAFAIALASLCFFYIQLSRGSPSKQVLMGSIAFTAVGLAALGFALV